MKKSILISAAAALTLQIAAQGKYTINGNLQNAEGQKIYLSVGDFGNTEIDSTVVANGKFTFQGEMQGPFESGSLFMGDLNDYRNVKSWGIAIEPMTSQYLVMPTTKNLLSSKVEKHRRNSTE